MISSLSVLLFLIPLSLAQSAESESPVLLSGRVVIITRAGDVKPARRAEIYLLSTEAHIEYNRRVNEELRSDRAELKALQEEALRLSAPIIDESYKASSEERDKSLLASKRVVRAFEWLQFKEVWTRKINLTWISVGEEDRVHYSLAGLEGEFEVELPDPDEKWMIVAAGRAGANEAIWESEVASGQRNVVLDSPDYHYVPGD